MKAPGELQRDLRCDRWGHGSCTTSDHGVGISNCSCPVAPSRFLAGTLRPLAPFLPTRKRLESSTLF